VDYNTIVHGQRKTNSQGQIFGKLVFEKKVLNVMKK
jgi:hypothetical protein